VLAVYKHLEAIPPEHADWSVQVRGAAALAGSLAARRADALLFRELATLRTDVPLAEPLAALRWTGPKPEFGELATLLQDPMVVERAARMAERAS
jgi:hypothetical protein